MIRSQGDRDWESGGRKRERGEGRGAKEVIEKGGDGH